MGLNRALCRLYGHQWRHPGTYEAVVVPDRESRIEHSVVCATCRAERALGRPESAWRTVDTDRSE